ncbi:MAG: tetratricopeptide repeat protein [Deltaproteobacteria bacterium]|nr:tetratricopeptide repeat protein [Deltaproteobacteria bacterium]
MKTITLPPNFVGRETELARLHEKMTQTIDTKRPHFFLIEGEFGTGKSDLIMKFLYEAGESSQKNKKVLTALGTCALEMGDSAYTPFRQILEQIGRKGFDKKAFIQLLVEIAVDWVDALTLVPIVGTSYKLTQARKKGKGISDENKFAQYTNLLQEIAARAPLFVAIDNLHFGDESSLRLIFHLMQNLASCPVFLICTARPFHEVGDVPYKPLYYDLRKHWQEPIMSLDSSQSIDVRKYLHERYGEHDLPANVIDVVQHRSGGHPLFVVELFSSWEMKRIIVQKKDVQGQSVWAWNGASHLNQSDVPDKIGTVIKQRIDQLTDQLRRLLTHAAVEGEEFTAQVVGSLLKLENLELFDRIEALEKNYRLIRRAEQPLSEELSPYRFVHIYFQSYIYNSLLNADKRRLLHHEIGKVLEKLYPDPRQIAAQLARHFIEAHHYSKALEYCVMAAEVEESQYNWYQAMRWCDRGIELFGKLPKGEKEAQELTRLRLIELKALGLSTSGDYTQACELYVQLISERERPELEPKRVIGWYIDLLDARDQLCEYRVIPHVLEEARGYLTKTQVNSVILEALISIEEAMYLGRTDRNQEALEIVRTAIARIEDLPPSTEKTAALCRGKGILAIILSFRGPYAESIAAYRDAADLGKSIDYMIEATDSLLNMADDLKLTNRLDEAVRVLEEVTDFAQRRGIVATQAQAMCQKGEVLFNLGKVDEAIPLLLDAGSRLMQIHDRMFLIFAFSFLALALLSKGEIASALNYARQAHGLCAWEQAYTLGTALDSLAQVEAAAGDHEAALRHFKEAISTFEKSENSHLASVSKRNMAEALIRFGDQTMAADLLQSALTAFKKEPELKHEIEKTESLLLRLKEKQ